jgi:predicted GNAT family N-acyltransferase
MNHLSFIEAKDESLLEEIYRIRTEVFVEEQKVDPEIEFDGYEAVSHHYLLLYDKEPIACARWRVTGPNEAKIERCAVRKAFRRKGYGTFLLQQLLKTIPPHYSIYLHAQSYVVPFYQKLGFQTVGEEFLEANIPHYKMVYVKPHPSSPLGSDLRKSS